MVKCDCGKIYIRCSKCHKELNPPSDSTELINNAIEKSFIEIDKGAEFIIDGKRYAGKWGCDTVQHFIDILRGA